MERLEVAKAYLPTVRFRTLNGFCFWPVAQRLGAEETESLRIRRVFEVSTPSGDTERCAVDLTTSVRGVVRERTGHEYPPEHPIWDAICRSALSNYLREKGELPPENLLVVGLTREQLETIRACIISLAAPWL